MLESTVSHMGLCVADLDRSLEFYCGLLGFKMLFRKSLSDKTTATINELDAVSLEFAFIEKDGLSIELLHFLEPGHQSNALPRAMNKLGFTHLSLRVKDIASSTLLLEQAGVKILRHTATTHELLGLELVFFLDPDGNRVELVSSSNAS